jgi:membrane protease YdiL (CAAX protease family)
MITKNRISSETQQVLIFYALAFAISWLVWSPLIFIPAMQDFAFLLFIGAYGPLAAGMITTRVFAGQAGKKAWLKTIFRWRIGLRWYLLAIFVLPLLIACLHLALYLGLGGKAALSTNPPWYWAVSVFPINVVLTIPLSSALEEAGWQGFALPKLASKFHPLIANLVHGLLWAAWHIPLYFTPVWGGREPIVLLFAYTAPLSMILFWLTCRASGSSLPAVFLHQATNHYSTLFTTTAVFSGTLGANFSGLKTIVYWSIAIVLLITTKSRLGFRESRIGIKSAQRVSTDGSTPTSAAF